MSQAPYTAALAVVAMEHGWEDLALAALAAVLAAVLDWLRRRKQP